MGLQICGFDCSSLVIVYAQLIFTPNQNFKTSFSLYLLYYENVGWVAKKVGVLWCLMEVEDVFLCDGLGGLFHSSCEIKIYLH